MTDKLLKGVLSMDSSKFKKGADDAAKSVDNLAGEVEQAKGPMDRLDMAAKALTTAGLLMLGQKAASVVWDLAKLGAEAIETEQAFSGMAQRAGGSASDMLAAMQSGTDGMISNQSLMQSGMQAMTAGLEVNAAQWQQLGQIAVNQADVMGLSTAAAFDAITEAMIRGTPRSLYQLGILPDLEAATQAYADKLGVARDALTETQERQALLNSVLDWGKTQMVDVGTSAQSMADSIEALGASWENLKVEIATTVAEQSVLNEALGGLTNILQGTALEAFAENLQRAALGGDNASKAMLWLGQNLGILPSAFSNADLGALDLAEHLDALRGTAEDTAAAIGEVAQATKSATAQKAQAVAGIQRYRSQLREDFEDELEAETDANEAAATEQVDIWRSAYSEQERAYKDLRSTIQSALQPTQVTALDFGLSESGQYVDKWDENARRLDAIAQRGFAELQAHADWGAILKIPPEVIAAGESALKEWASNVAGDVRDLSRPDLLNLDAAVAAVRAYMAKQEAIELSIDMVAAKMAEGGTGPSKEDIAVALGLQTAAVDVPINLVADAKEGEDASIPGAGMQLAKDLKAGVGAELKEAGMVGVFLDKFTLDISNNGEPLRNAGAALWQAVEPGIRGALKKTSWVREFAMHMAPYVADILKSRGQI